MIQEALRAARQAALAAGKIMKDGFGVTHQIEHKGLYDLVTEIDKACEEAIVEIVSKALPSASILAEESNPNEDSGGQLVWVVDPLDGTTNYAHGYPVYCCSIALRKDGETLVAVVYDPTRDEMFEATAGGGAKCNSSPIHVSTTRELTQCILATGFPYDRCESSLTNLDKFAALTMRTQGVRRSGSAALDLCHVAYARLYGFWEYKLNPWDVSAGVLLVREAGGMVSATDGSSFDDTGSDTCATNGILHDLLVEALGQTLPQGPCYG